jgi:hypothetical protein
MERKIEGRRCEEANPLPCERNSEAESQQRRHFFLATPQRPIAGRNKRTQRLFGIYLQ